MPMPNLLERPLRMRRYRWIPLDREFSDGLFLKWEGIGIIITLGPKFFLTIQVPALA